MRRNKTSNPRGALPRGPPAPTPPPPPARGARPWAARRAAARPAPPRLARGARRADGAWDALMAIAKGENQRQNFVWKRKPAKKKENNTLLVFLEEEQDLRVEAPCWLVFNVKTPRPFLGPGPIRSASVRFPTKKKTVGFLLPGETNATCPWSHVPRIRRFRGKHREAASFSSFLRGTHKKKIEGYGNRTEAQKFWGGNQEENSTILEVLCHRLHTRPQLDRANWIELLAGLQDHLKAIKSSNINLTI